MIRLIFLLATLAIVSVAAVRLRRTNPGILLLDAAERGDLATVKSLLQQGVSIDQTSSVKFGWTPLIGAIVHDKTNVIEYLVESGANVNLADKQGVTPLMWMTFSGDEGVAWVRFLIAHGASLDARDKYGATVFGYARGDPPKPLVIEALEEARLKQGKGVVDY